MTVREWFRLQRRVMWEAPSLPAAAEIDRLAYLIDFSHSPPPVDMITYFNGIVIPEEWDARRLAVEEAVHVMERAFFVTACTATIEYGRRQELIRGISD